MGRGRGKAKQTKVARELKYRTGGTDLQALQAELSGNGTHDSTHTGSSTTDDDELDEDDPYAVYTGHGGYDDEAEDEWLPSPRST